MLSKVIKEKIGELKIQDDEYNEYKKLYSNVVEVLKKSCRMLKVKAEVFVGGSFAKRTVIRSNDYDVDVFIRFHDSKKNISDLTERIVKKTCGKLKLTYKRVHGSRDYFQILLRHGSKNVTFEIVPVKKIKRPRDAENVTDLSYFHVSYVKKRLKGFEEQVLLAKAFCTAHGVYGAESYIHGFSGYALECLIIHYKSFVKMLRGLSKVKDGEKIVIDPAKHYKNKQEALIHLNESKLKSPIILIDPTYKERNAISSLSVESFEKFQKEAREFLAHPKISDFEIKIRDIERMKERAGKMKADFVSVVLTTDRPAGDIAGTKMQKFSRFVEQKIMEKFEILDKVFEYNGEQEARVFFVLKSKGFVLRKGPPVNMKDSVQVFRQMHKHSFVKDNHFWAKIEIKESAKEFLTSLSHDNKQLEEMSIKEMIVN